jgi:SNF2 family DNA or RNA helicase
MFIRIDGTVASSNKRQELMDRFNSDTSVCLCLLTTQVSPRGFEVK